MNGGLNTYGYVGGNPLYWIDSTGLYEEDINNLTKWIEKNTGVTMPEYGGFMDIPQNEAKAYYDPVEKKYYMSRAWFDRGLDGNGIYETCKTMVHESFHPDDNLLDKLLLGASQSFHQTSYINRAKKIVDDTLNKKGVPRLPDPTPFKPERGR